MLLHFPKWGTGQEPLLWNLGGADISAEWPGRGWGEQVPVLQHPAHQALALQQNCFCSSASVVSSLPQEPEQGCAFSTSHLAQGTRFFLCTFCSVNLFNKQGNSNIYSLEWSRGTVSHWSACTELQTLQYFPLVPKQLWEPECFSHSIIWKCRERGSPRVRLN